MADPKTGWEKADILLKGLLPLAVALVGYFTTSYLSERQRSEATMQFYTGLVARREEADSNLRKEMFRYIMSDFLGEPKGDPEKLVLGLEMLALNFHDSFDLSSLFKDAYQRIDRAEPSSASPEKRRQLSDRLIAVSQEITDRQVSALADRNHRWDRQVADAGVVDSEGLGSLPLAPIELPPLDGKKPPSREGSAAEVERPVLIMELLGADKPNKSLRLRIEIRRKDMAEPLLERTVVLSFFDFPALNSMRLLGQERVAVALRRFDDDSRGVVIQVIHFPETRASLKEKPYLDDLLEEFKVRRLKE